MFSSGRVRVEAADFDLQEADVHDVRAVGDIGSIGFDVLLRDGGTAYEQQPGRQN